MDLALPGERWSLWSGRSGSVPGDRLQLLDLLRVVVGRHFYYSEDFESVLSLWFCFFFPMTPMTMTPMAPRSAVACGALSSLLPLPELLSVLSALPISPSVLFSHSFSLKFESPAFVAVDDSPPLETGALRLVVAPSEGGVHVVAEPRFVAFAKVDFLNIGERQIVVVEHIEQNSIVQLNTAEAVVDTAAADNAFADFDFDSNAAAAADTELRNKVVAGAASDARHHTEQFELLLALLRSSVAQMKILEERLNRSGSAGEQRHEPPPDS